MALVVTLYARDGCHLCDEARRSLLALAAELGDVELAEVDIEGDERLLEAYLERIPVIELNGREISELEFDPDALRSALAHTVGP
jgi:glutaredoxin